MGAAVVVARELSSWDRSGESPVTKSTSVSVPLVSFLTTVYGTEDYLSATIESVLAQTSPDWEMVVVDNGLSPSVVGFA